MCDPITLTIASAAIAAGSQVYSGLSQRAQGRYEQQVAQQNRTVSLQARDDARARGEFEQMRHWRRVSQTYGEQKARQAASGLDIGFGSAADLMGDVMMIGGEDSQILAENVVKEQRGYEVEAANYLSAGRAARSRGNAALVGSGLQAFSTILGAASQVSRIRAAPSLASIGS